MSAEELGGVYDDLELPAGARRPYTAIQMVMTLDGAIKGPTDAYWPIGGEADQRTFRRFRIHFDAVLHGARTLGMGLDRYLWSDELRRARAAKGLTEPPLFVIVTNSARIDPADRVFRRRRYPLRPIVVTHEAADVSAALAEVAEIVRLGDTAVDLSALGAYLAAERGVRRLVCEGGAILNAHMLRAGLVDEFFITVTPSIIGEPRPRTAVEGERALAPDDVLSLDLLSVTHCQGEVFLRFRVPDTSPFAAQPS
ncbi:MAG: dihydrofolate reductase family protein [Chloroflexi bacterium]|nr:dihydrofolate reductase family protein [Chloroflexota bacterium]